MGRLVCLTVERSPASCRTIPVPVVAVSADSYRRCSSFAVFAGLAIVLRGITGMLIAQFLQQANLPVGLRARFLVVELFCCGRRHKLTGLAQLLFLPRQCCWGSLNCFKPEAQRRDPAAGDTAGPCQSVLVIESANKSPVLLLGRLDAASLS